MPGGSKNTPQEQTIRLAGSVVRLTPEAFASMLASEPVELVIIAPRYLFRLSAEGNGFLRRGWHSLAVSRRLVFFARLRDKPVVPSAIKVIEAEDVWVSLLGPKEP